MKKHLHKHVPQDVALGSLLALLFATAFLIVIPRLKALQDVPMAYYNELPVSNQSDLDKDGILDYIDGTPTGPRSPVVEIEEIDPAELEQLEAELGLLLSDDSLESELDLLFEAELE